MLPRVPFLRCLVVLGAPLKLGDWRCECNQLNLHRSWAAAGQHAPHSKGLERWVLGRGTGAVPGQDAATSQLDRLPIGHACQAGALLLLHSSPRLW